MTVLPDSPIDPSTSIQIPTIAVVTLNGISVIKDDGTVVDNSNTFSRYGVAFGEDLTLLVVENQSTDSLEIYDYPDYLSAGFSVTRTISNSPALYPSLNDVGLFPASIVKSGKNESWAVGTSGGGINLFQGYTQSGMVAYTASDYTSGWLNGDIKGAFLASTDNTSLVGGELVTDGSFSNGLTYWTNTSIGSGSATVSSGAISLVGTNGSNRGRIEQAVSLLGGSTYLVEYEVTMVSGALAFGFSTTSGFSPIATYETTSGVKTYYLTAPSGGAYIGFTTHIGGGNGTVDNVSVKLVDEDRSVNGKGLTPVGTITRSAVETGAELMAYSGFASASTWLEQSYNTDLNFGTGDFCVMGWVQEAAASDWIVDRMEGRIGSTAFYGFDVWQNSQNIRFSTYENNASTVVISNTDMAENTWYFFTAVRRSGLLEIYMQGELDNTASGTTRNISYSSGGTAPPLTIGAKNDGGNGFTGGKLALIRISSTAPTAEQIRRIYEDERYLFQENADCTLYGTSDAVTALAYDDSTNLLHAGTSAGRSMFQGLRRVDNTTTAVGTAISAQNNLVADE
jgi:hypothetical protein